MQTIRLINLHKKLGDVLRAADDEVVVVLNREEPRTVIMSSDEFIRLKVAAGEPVPPAVRKTKPTLHSTPDDPLGYDTNDPNYMLEVARHALGGEHETELMQEVERAQRRWGLR
jgi:urease accessory protein UreE